MEENKEFKPYISDKSDIKEFTFRGVFVGVVIGVVFGAANAYLGLKVGMTISASIPAAVISMAILRGILKKGTVLENNIVQTIASSGESLAAGAIFTIPALMFVGYSPSFLKIFLFSMLGGFLGILFMIPLRKLLIVKEHNVLPYPEGTACAEVLKSGDRGGENAKIMIFGVLMSGMYKFLMSKIYLLKETASYTFFNLGKATVAAELSPALLGVGYIIGPKIASLIFAGGVFGWLVLIPLISTMGADSLTAIYPAQKPVSSLSAYEIWSYYIRYIGAGAVALGGVVSLIKTIPVIFKSLKMGFIESFKNLKINKNEKRTDRDLPMILIIIGSVVTILSLWLVPGVNVHIVGISLIVFFGFFFVTVASRIVGIVGSSSSPVSGMTITALLFTSLIFLAIGYKGDEGIISALIVGAVICIAICMSGDISQDLKTGYLVGATPYKQQIAEFIGVIAPALAIGWVIYMLNDAYIIGSEKLPALQATIMSMVVKGVMTNSLPWVLVITGVFIGIAVEILGIAALPFALGLYLPLALSVPIMSGGIIYWIIGKFKKHQEFVKANEKAVLFCSGLVAGDALLGIIIAIIVSTGYKDLFSLEKYQAGNLVSLLIFCMLAGSILYFSLKKRKR